MKKVLILSTLTFMCVLFYSNLFAIDRKTFIAGKTDSEIKVAYSNLTPNEQKELWVDKLNQLLAEPLPKGTITLIQKIKNEYLISQDFKVGSPLVLAGIELAKVVPKEDFVNMISSLKDYKYLGKYEGTEICEKCITDMQTNYIPKPLPPQEYRPKCNCRWTCGWGYFPVSSDCERCTCCGFFFHQECTGLD